MIQDHTRAAVEVAWRGGDGRPAVFVHANGFPPLVYLPFLEALAERLQVTALAMRPLVVAGPPDPALQWADLGRDVIA